MISWFVLPILSSYTMAGDFSVVGRLKSSLVENAIYYLSLGSIVFFLLIYVAINTGLDLNKLKLICISAANTWGLIMLVVLLGYGLVEVPRSLFNESCVEKSLEKCYFSVAKINGEKCEAEEKVNSVKF